MSFWLIAIVGFILGISVLVAVHEFGHMWMARRCGVKVIRYSIGFGAVLWSKRSAATGTEYAISAIPLGGYVALLDDEQEEASTQDRSLSINSKSTLQKTLILLAGPAANFLLAIVLYSVVYMSGVSGYKPIVGNITEESYAYAVGLRAEDELTSVSDVPVDTWEDAIMELLGAAISKANADIGVVRGTQLIHINMNFTEFGRFEDADLLLKQIGVVPYRPSRPPLIDKVVVDSAAEKADLRSGDLVLQIDHTPVDTFMDLHEIVRKRPNVATTFKIKRDGQELFKTVIVGSKGEGAASVGVLGVYPVPIAPEVLAKLKVTKSYSLDDALLKSFEKSWSMSALTLKVIGRIIVRDASTKGISGPLTIAEGAGATLSRGFSSYLEFMAYVSLMLGLINLFPIPMLDGGRVVYYWAEALKGAPLSERVQQLWQSVGIALIVMLMFLAFYNDITRIAG